MPPEKKECRTRHCSQDADEGAEEQHKAGTLFGCGQGCFLKYKSLSAQVRRFLRSRTWTRNESEQVVAAALTCATEGIRFALRVVGLASTHWPLLANVAGLRRIATVMMIAVQANE